MQSDQVTVLVFKDNHPSRTFQLSLKWISQLGMILSAAAILLTVTSFLAFKFYRASRQGSVARSQALEQELIQLKASNQALESKLASAQSGQPAPKNQAEQEVPPPPTAPAAPIPMGPISTHLFRALPTDSAAPLPDRAKLPFNLTPPKLSWQGNNLQVSFGIQYNATDGGNQQGRIILLARGPDAMLTYPEGVLNPAGSEVLIQPGRGEYFSVSRFRATEATFGAVHSRSRLKEVEILIFDNSSKLIFVERLQVPETSAPTPRSKPKTKTEPASQNTSSAGAPAAPQAAPPANNAPSQ